MQNKKYTDNKKGAEKFAKDMYDLDYFNPTIFSPDPYVPYCWLAIDKKAKRVSVLYLNKFDEEGLLWKSDNPQDYEK